MKKLLLALSLILVTSSGAWAQNPTCPNRPLGDSSNACANTRFVQENAGGGGGGTPGGTTGQVQYKLNGTTFGGFTASGDATINTSTGAVSVTKSGGVAFGTAAFAATGTSGHTIPYLDGTNAWSGVNTFAAGDFVITGESGCATFSAGVLASTGSACGGSGSTGANPTASIGLTAVNGSAGTFLRSDGAPALSQAITPTWTNTHTFNNSTLAAEFDGGGIAINPTPASLSKGYNVQQTPHGASGSVVYNQVRVTADDVASTPGATTNISNLFYHEFGGSAMQGARINVMSKMTMTAASNASNAFKEYVALTGQLITNAPDGGTNTGAGAAGSFFASNFWAQATSGATNLFGVIGSEVNISIDTGASANRKFGWNIVALSTDAVQGAVWDAAYSVSSQTGAVGWNDGLLFNDANGQFPIKSNGNVVRATTGSVANGIDLSALTISSSAFKSSGFNVTGAGATTAASVTSKLFPAAGSFAAGTAQIYTSIGPGGTGLTFTAPTNTGGSTDTGFFSATGSQVFAIPTGTSNGVFGNANSTTSFAGQFRATFGTPTIASGACGTGTNGVVTSGVNQSGLITIGAAATTTCTISFSATLAVAPNSCTITPQNLAAATTSTTLARVSSISTSAWVITGAALANAAYYYQCF